jgi:hypothetical protein
VQGCRVDLQELPTFHALSLPYSGWLDSCRAEATNASQTPQVYSLPPAPGRNRRHGTPITHTAAAARAGARTP